MTITEKRWSAPSACSIAKANGTTRNLAGRKTNREAVQSAITYFRHHAHQMHCAQSLEQYLPIGSRVTEAGYKTIAKARLGGRG